MMSILHKMIRFAKDYKIHEPWEEDESDKHI